MFSVLCLLCLCARLFTCALWSPAGKGLTSWLSFVVSKCEFVTFPQVWYLIVSIPDFCTHIYFYCTLIFTVYGNSANDPTCTSKKCSDEELKTCQDQQ